MIDIFYLAALVTIIAGIITLGPVIAYLIKYIKNYKRKEKLKKNNIYIYIYYNSENPFSINYKRSTVIDYMEWYKKINGGGELYVEFEWLKEIEKQFNDKNINEETIKKIKNALRDLDNKANRIKNMIMIALLNDNISSKINCFPNVVEAIINKSFSAFRSREKEVETVILEVYNNKNLSFKFEIPKEEYTKILEISEGRIKIKDFVYFNEFMNMLEDKTILESEIIPNYLMTNVRINDEILIEDFTYWYISLG